MSVYFFPIILMVIDVCAAAVYLFNGNIKQAIYWVAAAVLSACVTF